MKTVIRCFVALVVFVTGMVFAQNVGIGTAMPTERLHVSGNLRFDGALMPNGDAGTTGQILVSQGPGTPPQWQTIWYLYHVDAWGAGSTDPGTQGWTGANTTQCGQQWMLGGYGQCGSGCVLSKTFTSLPPHSAIMVEVDWWSIDSWDQSSGVGGIDIMKVRIDGNDVAIGIPTAPYGSVANSRNTDVSYCGNTRIDQGPQTTRGVLSPHTSSSTTIDIVSGVNEGATNESLGVVMVRIWLKP
jgi:hypothetical protein